MFINEDYEEELAEVLKEEEEKAKLTQDTSAEQGGDGSGNSEQGNDDGAIKE